MEDEQELRRRLAAGDWLTPGEVGVLFRKDRTTIHRWIKLGKFGFRRTIGGHRELDPGDVRAELAGYEQRQAE